MEESNSIQGEIRSVTRTAIFFYLTKPPRPQHHWAALNVALWYACRKGNAASCSDAIQAFLQSELDDNDLTYVIIPTELWLDEWHKKFQTGTKLVVRLKKSLYGHPRAGRWWQDHLDHRLRNLGAQETSNGSVKLHNSMENWQ